MKPRIQGFLLRAYLTRLCDHGIRQNLRQVDEGQVAREVNEKEEKVSSLSSFSSDVFGELD